MPSADPFAQMRDWRLSLYRGDRGVIDRFLDGIDASLPSGWGRDSAYERTRLKPDLVRCFLFSQTTGTVLRLWLQRVTATRVRGGPVQVLRHSGPGGVQIPQLVAEFAAVCVLPAAAAAGVRCTRPAFGPRSAVTPAAEMLLTRLADTADGQWPLPIQAQSVWDDLVSTCLAEQVAIDRAELDNWLVASGWDQGAVAPIADRFYVDSECLAKQLAVMSP